MSFNIKALALSSRLSFLILTPVSIFLGLSVAHFEQSKIQSIDFVLVLVAALSAHISVNTFNEYFDFKSGLDAKTIKTPFSGGSGALIDNPSSAPMVLYLALASLMLTTAIGLYFVANKGLLLLPIGLIGLVIIVTYTHWLNRLPIVCLFAPGLAFGPLMIVGTYFVLTESLSCLSILVSLVPFFLVNNLLLLNQLPDIDADQSVGRKHFSIAYGVNSSMAVYASFSFLCAATIIGSVVSKLLPFAALLSLIPLIATFTIYKGVKNNFPEIEKLIPFLGINVFITLATSATLSVCLIFSN